MKPILKKKLLSIFTAFVYFGAVLAITLTLASLLRKSYFSYVFVSGGSMNPTLIGGHDSGARAPYINDKDEYVPGDIVHFGVTDESYKAKRNIHRYDIVTTYYPWEDYNSDGSLKSGASYKIKRVIALPGETFKIEQGDLYIKNDGQYSKIERAHLIDDSGNKSIKDVAEKTLKENEYWVMGDHRSASKDCVTSNKPVTFDSIIGVLISIEGTAEYFVHYYCSHCHKEIDDKAYLIDNVRTCDSCSYPIVKGSGDIRNREYTYPRII